MRSVKIVGLSGTGKTTLIHEVLERLPQAVPLGYSQLCAKHGPNMVDDAWRRELDKNHPLYLIDEHLEFGDGLLEERYREENTAGIVHLVVSPPLLIERRLLDKCRQRDAGLERIRQENALSEERARHLSAALGLPLLFLYDERLETSVETLIQFIQHAG